jgi:hypothetical protein
MSEPSIEDAMRWLSAGQIAPDGTLRAEVQSAGQDDYDYRARCVYEAFRSEAGRVALETLLKVTLFRAPVDHRLPSEGEYLRFAQLRQGQNQAAAALLAYFDHGQSLERPRASAPLPTDDAASDLLAGRRSYGSAADDAGDPASWLDWFDGGPGVAVTA